MHLQKNFLMNLFMVIIMIKIKLMTLLSKTDVITYEFENIPYETLNEINKSKSCFTQTIYK